ncbi:MAG TPA: hypothetical protein VF835_01265 [Rhizomicrobium sp.]
MPRLGAVGTRVTLMTSLALAIAGCADPETNFFPQDSQFEDARCHAIANDRANDAAVTEKDTATQLQVFRLTYTGCIDWHHAH